MARRPTKNMQNTAAPEPVAYDCGAKRSEILPYYRLIPAVFLEHVGKTFTEGNIKYEKGNPATCNWRTGGLAYQLGCLDHLTAHVINANQMILDVGTGDRAAELSKAAIIEELAHAAVNIAFLLEYIEKKDMLNTLAEAAIG